MSDRLAETHGANFELVRHFLGRLFESEMVTEPGEWRKAAIGMLAGIIPAAVLWYPGFVRRYTCVDIGEPSLGCPPIANYAAQYLRLVRMDSSWLISLAICLTALVTALQWQSLFPSKRDWLALASLPVSPRQIFGAKFAALLAAFAVWVVALNGLPATLFAGAIASRWQAHSVTWNAAHIFLAMAAASGFAFFTLLAVQGAMLVTLPARMFARASVAVQALLFTASVAALPFAWREQPVDWFTAVRGGHFRSAAMAVLIPAAVALVTYLGGFYRSQRMLLESPRRSRGGEFRLASRALELLLPDPREQAAFAFLGKTLFRSRVHQLVLQITAGLAAAWVIQGVHERAGSVMEATVILGPLAGAAFATVGLRYLFSLPAELRANWLFQTTETEGRTAWLRATDRFVIWCFLAPVYLCAAPVAVTAFGWQEAARLLATSFAMALVLFEFWFRDWHKLPFTCSHLPGQRPAWLLILIGMGALSYFGTAAFVIYQTSRGWVVFAAVFPLVCALWRKLRANRRKTWDDISLVYEQLPEAAVQRLDLHFEPESEPAVAAETEPGLRSTPLWDSFSHRKAIPAEPFPKGDRSIAPLFRLGGLWADMRFGLRLMRKDLGLSVGVTLTLALGIGVNVTMLTLINGVAFRAPVDEPETFVQVAFPYSGASAGVATPDEYLSYRDRTRSLASLAALTFTDVIVGSDRSNQVKALLVSCNFFEVYHLRQAKLGRLFTPAECAAPGGAAVAVLSEEVWRDRFGSDPRIIGQVIPINDAAFTVVGIAPARHPARFNRSALWIPYTAQPLLDPVHDIFRSQSAMLVLFGRLAPGVSRTAAQAEWDVMVEQDNALHPGRIMKVAITDGSPISTVASGASRLFALALLLMAAPWAMLLITCANVANMLLSRAVSRRREIAVRLAVGAPRMRLLRMLLMESCVLAAAAGLAALYISYHAPAFFYRYVGGEPANFSLDPDWRIFTFVFAVVAATGCLAGLAPAIESLRVDLTSALKGYFSMGASTTGFTVRGLLVSAQVALGLVLLVCAGLVATSDRRLYTGDYGIDASHVLVAPLHFPVRSSPEAARAVYDNLERRIAALPGVQAITYDGDVPLTGGTMHVRPPGSDSAVVVEQDRASSDYFHTLGIPLVDGHDLAEADVTAVPPRAVVSQSFARMFLPHGDPIGQHFDDSPAMSFDVVGVARDLGDNGPTVYVQSGLSSFRTNVVVRISGDPHAASEAIRTVVRDAYPDFLVSPRPLQELLNDGRQLERRMVLLLLLLAGVAVVLAVVGVYGVVEFSVSQRLRELGIRAALGARPSQLVREVLSGGLKPVIFGLFAGVWLALVVESVVKAAFTGGSMRFDTGNPAIYAAGTFLLVIAAVAAMLRPARRGSRSDPARVLYYE